MTEYITPTTWEQCADLRGTWPPGTDPVALEEGAVNEPIFEVWRAVNEAAMAEDVSLIRRLVADAGIQPGVHVGRDPSEFTPVITAEWALGQWADMIDNGSPFLNSARNISISFRRCLANDCRYRVPASWSWSPEPPAPDDLVSRARRHAETHPESRELIEELLEELLEAVVRWACFAAPSPVPPWPDGVLRDAANRLRWIANSGYIEDPGIKRIIRSWADELDATPVPPWPGDENDDTARLSPDQGDRIVNACCRMLGCEPADIDGDAALEEILTEAVERCADLHGQDRWEDDCHGCGFRVGDHTTDGRCPAPATPVPPWPGAVLSGLVDEDGVPTWLAQAGQVRGEQVRRRSDLVWVNNDQMVAFSDTVWVEVRAPRAVPEPETERVPWWEARDRLGLAGDPFVEVGSDDEGPWVRVVEGGTKLHSPVDPDGTVEVLRQDGDR